MSISYENVCAFLYREARHLDERDWDSWLACYDEKASFAVLAGFVTRWLQSDTD